MTNCPGFERTAEFSFFLLPTIRSAGAGQDGEQKQEQGCKPTNPCFIRLKLIRLVPFYGRPPDFSFVTIRFTMG